MCAMLGCAGAGIVFAVASVTTSFEIIFICTVSSGMLYDRFFVDLNVVVVVFSGFS